MRACKVDANQAAIVKALREYGCSVTHLHRVGDGCPDLLVGINLRTGLAEVVRFMIVGSHYRSPLNHSDAQLDQAKAGLDRLYLALRAAPDAVAPDVGPNAADPAVQRFHAAMQDDFNTPEAFAVLFDLANQSNAAADPAVKTERAGLLKGLGAILGLLQQDPAAYLKSGGSEGGGGDAEIDALVAARIAARKAKDFKESDRLRDELKARGILLEDGPGGTTWRRG